MTYYVTYYVVFVFGFIFVPLWFGDGRDALFSRGAKLMDPWRVIIIVAWRRELCAPPDSIAINWFRTPLGTGA